MKTTLLTFISAAALTCAISTYALNKEITVTGYEKTHNDGEVHLCETGSCKRNSDDFHGPFQCECETYDGGDDSIIIYFDMGNNPR